MVAAADTASSAEGSRYTRFRMIAAAAAAASVCSMMGGASYFVSLTVGDFNVAKECIGGVEAAMAKLG